MTKSRHALNQSFGFGDQGDAVYTALVAMHDGLSDADSTLVNARLILLLANHIGDPTVVKEAIAEARRGIAEGTGAT